MTIQQKVTLNMSGSYVDCQQINKMIENSAGALDFGILIPIPDELTEPYHYENGLPVFDKTFKPRMGNFTIMELYRTPFLASTDEMIHLLRTTEGVPLDTSLEDYVTQLFITPVPKTGRLRDVIMEAIAEDHADRLAYKTAWRTLDNWKICNWGISGTPEPDFTEYDLDMSGKGVTGLTIGFECTGVPLVWFNELASRVRSSHKSIKTLTLNASGGVGVIGYNDLTADGMTGCVQITESRPAL